MDIYKNVLDTFQLSPLNECHSAFDCVDDSMHQHNPDVVITYIKQIDLRTISDHLAPPCRHLIFIDI